MVSLKIDASAVSNWRVSRGENVDVSLTNPSLKVINSEQYSDKIEDLVVTVKLTIAEKLRFWRRPLIRRHINACDSVGYFVNWRGVHYACTFLPRALVYLCRKFLDKLPAGRHENSCKNKSARRDLGSRRAFKNFGGRVN
jgi:hypothetical protein